MMLERLIEVHGLAKRLLDEYGLSENGWTFDVNSAKSFVGYCEYKTKKIYFSQHYLTETPWEEVEDTIRHEIAHALAYRETGESQGHNDYWRSVAVRLGARPQSCAVSDVFSGTYKYKLECPDCGRFWLRHRIKFRGGAICSRCKTQLKIYEGRFTK